MCGERPGSFLRSYGTQVLCRECFLADVEAQVHETIQRYQLIVPGDVVGVGVSGGKDSATLLHILDVLIKRFPREYAGVVLKMVAVNEGIRGYRDESLACVRHCQRVYGHELIVVSFKEEFGRDLDELVAMAGNRPPTGEFGNRTVDSPGGLTALPQQAAGKNEYYFASDASASGGALSSSPGNQVSNDLEDSVAPRQNACGCSFCGILRRNSLTRGAERLGCNKLATGHNGDDNAETVLLNLMRGDWGKLSRCARPCTDLEGGVPRIKPLFFLSQKAVILYAYLRRLRFHSVPCPYAVSANRGKARALLSSLSVQPGYADSALRVIESVRGVVGPAGAGEPRPGLRRCEKCGSLLVGTKCQTCEIASAQTPADLWEALRVKPQRGQKPRKAQKGQGCREDQGR